MAGTTVYHDVTEGFDLASGGTLFAGKKFWVAQRVPSRNRLLDNIKANGGEIVLLEKKADYLVADHSRRDCPPGSISWKFVDESIEQGELCDPKDHPAGPPLGEAREAGATHQPTRSGRAAYTAEEDRILYKWVRDAESRGGLVSGNEIYKQLEQKYPRHSWQSWRDRYLKQLKDRPPSAFNIPDNAPPSPPSDQSNKRTLPAPSSSDSAQQQTSKKEQASTDRKVGGKGKARAEGDYSVNELTALFSTDDWLEVYAFVDLIDDLKGDDRYDSSWVEWAKNQGNQTAEQWRQYFEKVVRPQWLRDPASKREQIKKQIEDKYGEGGSDQSQSIGQQFPESIKPEKGTAESAVSQEKTATEQSSDFEHERFEELLNEQNDGVPPAYKFFAREKKQPTLNKRPNWDFAALHDFLLARWHSLSDEERAPYLSMNEAVTTSTLERATKSAKQALDVKVPSSSTVQHESPKFYSELQEKFMKRLREDDDTEEQEEEVELTRPTKRRKSGSKTPTRDGRVQPAEKMGTGEQPLEISSTGSSQHTTQSETNEEQTGPINPDTAEDDEATMVELEGPDAEKEIESIESDELPGIDQLPKAPPGYETVSEDDLPSNTPTPRATRRKVSNFDTQAILSSPIQSKFPPPLGFAQGAKLHEEPRFSSPAQVPESDASTTQSMEEFRRSLQEEDLTQPTYSQHAPHPLRLSSSPAPSTASSTSTDSGDPDPPLTAAEIHAFYDEQNEQGWSNDFISAALKRTRLRPELTVKVLDAWKLGKPLPNERGIWSKEDDVAVESGDGFELAKLGRKHSVDGWGGVTERLVFLEGYRSR
ncbi:transcription factor protein [Stemphylium lycopersici]|uniref:DNA-binding protein RAP1 n=1 Tax=Stemphylium lycopersici TaxID=183478 RepID=A0A364N985_STELY|nr:transcription factor protein [Stemphylium lycopersici]RAR13571.1 transcription factor protein [Stemphylium lycopersici]